MSALPAGQAGVVVECEAMKNTGSISDVLVQFGMIATDNLEAICPDWILARWAHDLRDAVVN